LDKEKVSQSRVAKNLGILSTYVSMIYNGDKSHRCSISAWDRVKEWRDSGKTLTESKFLKIPIETKLMPSRQPGATNNYPLTHYTSNDKREKSDQPAGLSGKLEIQPIRKVSKKKSIVTEPHAEDPPKLSSILTMADEILSLKEKIQNTFQHMDPSEILKILITSGLKDAFLQGQNTKKSEDKK
jgi:hypothetical protein